MAEVQFPYGLDGTDKLPRTIRGLENCWYMGDRIIARPGIESLNTTSKVARGQFEYNDYLYQVISNDLIRVATDGTYTVIGTIAGTNLIDYAVGFNHVCIIVRGGKGYTLDIYETLTEITSPYFEASNSVEHINGRFVFIPSNGDPAFFSDVGNANSIQSTSFFDAEELPDKNEVTFNLKNTLYIGGTDSFELFRDTGASPVPFTRLTNGRIQNGYIGGLLEYNNSYLFVGREKDQDLGIYAISQGSAAKISNEYADTLLHTFPRVELENIVASRFKWNGYDIAAFSLPGFTLGFYGGNWFRLSTQKFDEPEEWAAGFITEYKSDYYTAYKDKIGKLADLTSDYGEGFSKSMQLAYETEDDFSVSMLKFSISQGATTGGAVGIRLSKDGKLFSEPVYRDTGGSGQYDQELEWVYPGGMGYYNGFMGIKLIATGDVNFSGSKLIIK